MTSFDYAVMAIIGLSVLISVFRGLVKELLSIVSWFLAFVVAKFYTEDLVFLLPDTIPSEGLRYLAAFLILFLATLLVLTLLGIALSKIIQVAGMGWIDKLLGVFFGLARGVFVVCLIVMLAGLTSLPQQPAWRSALLSAPLEATVELILPWLPSSLAEKINFD